MGINPSSCYIIMPFSSTKTLDREGWTQVFEKLFKPTIELYSISCIRSDVKAGAILQHIVRSIHEAAFVMADLTDSRPNVFYELGIAHTMRNQVIMVSQNLDDCPSDLKPYGIIHYVPKPTHEELLSFQVDLRNALMKISHPETQASPVHQYLGRTFQKLESQLNSPVALMQCLKCGRSYHLKVGETTHSNFFQGQTTYEGRPVQYISAEHLAKGLCGHWESAVFRGLIES
jgi:hypothetical protein